MTEKSGSPSMWVGIVVNREDPNESGKMQVDIHGQTNMGDKKMKMEDLPWAIPVMNNEPSLNKIGSTANYMPHSTVFGVTMDDPMCGRVHYILGSIPRGQVPDRLKDE
jgi:hypothetical protein